MGLEMEELINLFRNRQNVIFNLELLDFFRGYSDHEMIGDNWSIFQRKLMICYRNIRLALKGLFYNIDFNNRYN